MTTSSGTINFDSQQMSSPLTTLVRKASAHRPNGGPTQTPTQPQSPLIHTKFRGSVATASSYDTSKFQDEESVLVDVQVSTLLFVLALSQMPVHPYSIPTVHQWSLSRTGHQDPHPAGSGPYVHPAGSIPAITIHPSPGNGVSSLLYAVGPYWDNLAVIRTHLYKIWTAGYCH
jgi:hypothetical protein